MTERKKELIEGSRTEAQTEAVRLAEAINSCDKPVALAMKDIVSWVRSQVQGKVFDTDLELRKAMKDHGCSVLPKRIKVFGMLQYVVLNNHRAWETIVANGGSIEDEARARVIKPQDLMEGGM
jgi:hypothetical protein